MKTTPTRKKKTVVWGVWLTVWVMVTGSATGVGMVESQRLLFDSHQGPILDQEATALLSAASSAQSQSPNRVLWFPGRWDMAPTSTEKLNGSMSPTLTYECNEPKKDNKKWILLAHTNSDKRMLNKVLKGMRSMKRSTTLCFKFDSSATEKVGKCRPQELIRSSVESSAISCPCQALVESMKSGLVTEVSTIFLLDAIGADSSTCAACVPDQLSEALKLYQTNAFYLHHTGTTQSNALKEAILNKKAIGREIHLKTFNDLSGVKRHSDNILKDTLAYSKECPPQETEELKCMTVGGKKECSRTDNGDCHICKAPELVRPDDPDFKASQSQATCPQSQLCVPCNPFICLPTGGSPKEVLTETDPVPWTCNPKRENRIYILIDPNSFQQKWNKRLSDLLDDVADKTTPEKDFSVTTISLATFDNPTHPILEEPATANLKETVGKIKTKIGKIKTVGNPACYCSGLWSLLGTLGSTLPTPPTSHVIMVADTETPPDPRLCHDVPINCQHTLYDLDLHNVHLYVWSKDHKPTNKNKLFNIRKQDLWVNMEVGDWDQKKVNEDFMNMMVPECVTGWCVYDMGVERCSGGYGRRGMGECGVSDVPGLFHFHRAEPESALNRLRPICAPMRQPCDQQSDKCTQILEKQEEHAGDEVLEMKVISAKRDLGMDKAITLVVISASTEKEKQIWFLEEVMRGMKETEATLHLHTTSTDLLLDLSLVLARGTQLSTPQDAHALEAEIEKVEAEGSGSGKSCLEEPLKKALSQLATLAGSNRLPIHVVVGGKDVKGDCEVDYASLIKPFADKYHLAWTLVAYPASSPSRFPSFLTRLKVAMREGDMFPDY